MTDDNPKHGLRLVHSDRWPAGQQPPSQPIHQYEQHREESRPQKGAGSDPMNGVLLFLGSGGATYAGYLCRTKRGSYRSAAKDLSERLANAQDALRRPATTQRAERPALYGALESLAFTQGPCLDAQSVRRLHDTKKILGYAVDLYDGSRQETYSMQGALHSASATVGTVLKPAQDKCVSYARGLVAAEAAAYVLACALALAAIGAWVRKG